jgi:hypothetical protein
VFELRGGGGGHRSRAGASGYLLTSPNGISQTILSLLFFTILSPPFFTLENADFYFSFLHPPRNWAVPETVGCSLARASFVPDIYTVRLCFTERSCHSRWGLLLRPSCTFLPQGKKKKKVGKLFSFVVVVVVATTVAQKSRRCSFLKATLRDLT